MGAGCQTTPSCGPTGTQTGHLWVFDATGTLGISALIQERELAAPTVSQGTLVVLGPSENEGKEGATAPERPHHDCLAETQAMINLAVIGRDVPLSTPRHRTAGATSAGALGTPICDAPTGIAPGNRVRHAVIHFMFDELD